MSYFLENLEQTDRSSRSSRDFKSHSKHCRLRIVGRLSHISHCFLLEGEPEGREHPAPVYQHHLARLLMCLSLQPLP